MCFVDDVRTWYMHLFCARPEKAFGSAPKQRACRAHPVQTPASHQLKTSSGHHARRRLGLPGCVIALPIRKVAWGRPCLFAPPRSTSGTGARLPRPLAAALGLTTDDLRRVLHKEKRPSCGAKTRHLHLKGADLLDPSLHQAKRKGRQQKRLPSTLWTWQRSMFVSDSTYHLNRSRWSW